MDYKKYYELLLEHRMITPIWLDVCKLLETQIDSYEKKDTALILFLIYFSLINDGNLCMSLDSQKLYAKMDRKLNETQVLLASMEKLEIAKFTDLQKHTLETINNSLDILKSNELANIIGDDKIFVIRDNWLYTQKFNSARESIIASLKRIFVSYDNSLVDDVFDNALIDGVKLADMQKKAITSGINNSLIITGGPGTGKTTSILFLLMAILRRNENVNIYLAAPSGKASSRMKESIDKNFGLLTPAFKQEYENIINKIKGLENFTIHRLLEANYDGSFKYNKNHQFSKNSVFVIDEASMIDINLFASLLEAIPSGARIYLMGDKDQLPSVETGAVFEQLLCDDNLEPFKVKLNKSQRFGEQTIIYKLAEAINNSEKHGDSLPISLDEWKNYEEFAPIKYQKPKEALDLKPIFYYLDHSETAKNKDIIAFVTNKWSDLFYKKLQSEFTNVVLTGNLEEDKQHLNDIFKLSEAAKILVAENEGYRGVKIINKQIKNSVIERKGFTSYNDHYAGELLMINKNNKLLDLYNGDSGVSIKFKDDDTIYLMVRKLSDLYNVDEKLNDKIFKLGDFLFYPLRLISANDLDLAYAITIHKSQGSDYENILVVLPEKSGHPLTNRQIVYTAITRTKGYTYILSNSERLNEAKNKSLTRDTNIANCC